MTDRVKTLWNGIPYFQEQTKHNWFILSNINHKVNEFRE